MLIACAWLLVLPLSAIAADGDASAGNAALGGKRADALLLDLSVPQSPAFVALGVTPDKVTHPASPRELATALQSGTDDSGNLQTGVAIETVPYLLLFGEKLSLGLYGEDRLNWRRLLARTQMSLGTTKGTDQNDRSVRLALGFRITPWDEGDTRLDPTLRECIASFQSEVVKKMHNITPATEAQIRKKLGLNENQDVFQAIQMRAKDDLAKILGPELYRKIWSFQEQQNWESGVEQCFTDAKSRNWNASAWDIGIAPTWISGDGSYRQLSSNGSTVWTSLGLRVPDFQADSAHGESDPTLPEAGFVGYLHEHSQFLLHARYRWNTMVNEVGTASLMEENDLLLGGRLRLGLYGFAISAEGAYIRQDPQGQSIAEGQRYTMSVDIRLTQGLWLHLAAGSNEGVNGGSQGIAFGGLRYGLTTDSPTEAWNNL